MRKHIAIVQSNYIPWKGYFDLINMVDEFILFDDAQYTKRDWRNRNRIKTPDGPMWLSVPVEVKGRRHQKVAETVVSDPDWNVRHWNSITHNYAQAACFSLYKEYFQELYLGCAESRLSAINFRFLKAICSLLGIDTRLSWSSDYHLADGKTHRLVSLCRQAGASAYLSGPAARSYLDEAIFTEAGIEVHYMDYGDYPEYRQLFPPFTHEVSVLDLLFNEGSQSPNFMKSFSKNLNR